MVRLLTLAVCTIGGGIFSELIQLVINSTRIFDLHDIIANILGSLTGLLGCTIYEHYAIKWAKARRSRAVHNYVQLETIPEESPITPGVKDLVADQV